VTLDPQVRKVSAACSGLFFEVSSQYNQPSKGVYDQIDQLRVVTRRETLHGAASALEPVAAGMGVTLGYTVADYLQQYAAPQRHRQPIPHHTWDALLEHTHHPTDATRLAQAATNRLLYTYALPLLHQSADAGDARHRSSI
jgi:hypothetical protein